MSAIPAGARNYLARNVNVSRVVKATACCYYPCEGHGTFSTFVPSPDRAILLCARPSLSNRPSPLHQPNQPGDKAAPKMSAQACLDVVAEIWEKKCEADAADKKAMNDPDTLVEFIEEHFLHKYENNCPEAILLREHLNLNERTLHNKQLLSRRKQLHRHGYKVL
jgi:hypothetical protein